MSPPTLLRGTLVLVRRLAPTDADTFVGLVAESQGLHAPWVAPPRTSDAFAAYLDRVGPSFEAIAVCRVEDEAIAGVFNISQIFHEGFQSAHLGFYAFAPSVGQGYMAEGLELVTAFAFETLGLHRVEANIQPENEASIRIVREGGFEREGFSKNYLRIGDAWRDHERWAIRREIWGPRPA